jgi:hypothetical protein
MSPGLLGVIGTRLKLEMVVRYQRIHDRLSLTKARPRRKAINSKWDESCYERR